MKKTVVIFVMLFLVASFIGCNSKEETTSQVTSQTDNITTAENLSNDQFSIGDFYNEFIIFKEHIDDIISEKHTEKTVLSNGDVTAPTVALLSSEDYETYTREEILTAHNNTTFDLVQDDYIEQLTTTEAFMSDVLDLLENQEDIHLFEPFHPEGDTSKTYEFIMSESGYILIDALYDTVHLYLKMGLDNELLDYQEFHYYYSGSSPSPKEGLEMTFNYFKFLEDKEAVYVNSNADNASLRYTNIQDDEQFVVSKGNNLIEGPEYEETGYSINIYDRETNVRSYLQIVNNEIIGEAYDVFDDNGSVYLFDDYMHGDGVKSLQINIATATGWDYVVANRNGNDENDELSGIFLNDGTKLFSGRFNCTYTENYGFVGVWINLDETTEITDELFSLNQYGMDLEHPKANVAFLNEIKLENFDAVKEGLQIDNLNFFAENLSQELYNYVDQDIRDDIEGKNQEPIVTTGDVEAFLDIMEQFNQNVEETPNYHTDSAVTIRIYDNEQVISESTSTNTIDFDLNAKYYRNYTHAGSTNYSYVLDGTKDQLIEFEIKEISASYYILSDQATISSFMEAYEDVSGSTSANDMLDNVKTITQIDDSTFELDVTTSFLGEGGIDLSVLLEQQGIVGLSDQTIIITFAFNDDLTDYSVSYTLENLSFDDYEVEISSHSLTEIKSVTIMSPQDLEYLVYYLPQSIDQTEFDLVGGNGYYAINRGTSYLRTYLEPGQYTVNLNGLHYDPDFIVLDKDSNTLECIDQRFEATYEGYYYIKITSTSSQNLDVKIRYSPTPQIFEFDLDGENGTFEEHINVGGYDFYSINVPNATYDRLLAIHPYLFSEDSEEPILNLWAEIEEINFHDGCDFNSNKETCYLYLPANQIITFSLYGYYEGEFGFDYEYYEIPQGDFDNTHTWNDYTEPIMLWITDDSPVAHVDFSITETGSYRLDSFYKDIGYSYQKARLCSSDGTQLTFDWDYAITLEPGDYYIEYYSDYSQTLLLFIVAEIIQE